MVAFTDIEQETMDLSWYAIDSNEKIGHFTTGGSNLLPPSIAKDKEKLQLINDFFTTLQFLKGGGHKVCQYLLDRKEEFFITDIDGYTRPSSKMSDKGLYSFDSLPIFTKRDYFRVTIPENELNLEDLPEDIRNILGKLQMKETSFAEDSTIPEEITARL